MIVAVLAAFAFVPGGAISAPAGASAACKGAGAEPREARKRVVKRAIRCLLDKKRAKAGLRGLSSNRKANRAADRHSRYMRETGCFAHQCEGEPDLLGRLEIVGYIPCSCSWGAGENIAWGDGWRGTPKQIVKAWMNSPGHRANILNGNFEHLGVAVSWGSPTNRKADAAVYTTVFGFRG